MKNKSSDTTVIDAALRAQLRALMMPGIARKLDELLRHAESEHASYQQLLLDVLTAEVLPVKVVEPRRGEPVTVLLRSGHMLKVSRDFDEVVFARVVAL